MIGFLAKKHRGKDTASDFLVNNYGYTKNAFAHPLKKCIQELFGFTDEQLFTDKKEEKDERWGISPRKAFQVFGTDIVRDLFPKMLFQESSNIGNNFWIKRADIWYNNNRSEHKGLVVWSDVRFQNEVDYILKNGGRVFKIDRPVIDSTEWFDGHSSEIELDKIINYTDVIINDGNVDELYEKIRSVIK